MQLTRRVRHILHGDSRLVQTVEARKEDENAPPIPFLYNLLPDVAPISNIETNPETIDPTDEKAVKKAIVHFAMAIGRAGLYDQSEQFRATQLLDRSSTEGFVKVRVSLFFGSYKTTDTVCRSFLV